MTATHLIAARAGSIRARGLNGLQTQAAAYRATKATQEIAALQQASKPHEANAHPEEKS